MCISPTILPNPNYGSKLPFSFMKDTVSRFIKVPCGVCSECVHIKQLNLVQRCIMESQTGYPFFCTLTYNNESLPQLECPDGRKIRYADISDVQNMIKRIRKDNLFGRPFRHLTVSELGSKRARPHFHILFFVKKYSEDSIYVPYNLERTLFSVVLSQWKRNYGSKRNPVYRPLCQYVSKFIHGKLKSTYDLHFVSPSTLNGSTLDVPFYVTKYMLKPSDKSRRIQQALRLNLESEDYDRIWSKVKPRWFSSLNFGFGVYGLQPRYQSKTERLSILQDTEAFKHVRFSLDRSLLTQDRPKFYDPESGKTLPFSAYWKSFGNLYTMDDHLTFFYKDPNQRADNVQIDEREISEKLLSFESHQRQLRQIDEHEENFNLLFD